MKSILSLLSLFAISAGSLVVVHAQSTNYLLASHNASLTVLNYYHQEIALWREFLTGEGNDMGVIYTNLTAEAMQLATTAAQGAGISDCAALAGGDSRYNIIYMDNAILHMETDAYGLHSTVLDLLMDFNIKDADLEIFYYVHGYVAEQYYEKLFNYHMENVFNASWYILLDFFYIYNDLTECLNAVLDRTMK